jgi:putative ABC transport system permease protein
MRSRSLFLRLAIQNLSRRRGRAFLLAVTVAVGGGAVFTAMVLRQAIQDSIALGLSRMGADVLVVPRDTAVNLAAALLTVEPTSETFSSDISDALARLPGVQTVAPQRYHALVAGGASHGQDDLIAYDPARDFTVIPWLRDQLDRPLRRGDLIVGGRRAEAVGSQINLFGQAFIVYGKLNLTGVGPFERSIFASFETVADIAEAARRVSGRKVLDADPHKHSGLLVRMAIGSTPEQFRFAAARLPEVKVVSGSTLYSSVRQGLTSLLSGAVGLTTLMLLSTALMVAAMYSGLLSERQRELGLFLAIGLRPRQMVRMIVAEAALTTGCGGTCGVILGAAGIFFFQRSLGYHFESFQIPFVLPTAASIFTAGAISALLAAAVGVIGVLVPALRLGRQEPYDLVRGEG